MISQESSMDITPAEFELAVRGILDAAADSLINYESTHLASLSAHDGTYKIDVVARFEALGGHFCVLVECKHHKRKIERGDVQVLQEKVTSLGAQKGMLFSTSGFQKGAIEYADAHGIALVQVAAGTTTWFTKSTGSPHPPPSWVNLPQYVGWWCHGNCQTVLSEDNPKYTRAALGL